MTMYLAAYNVIMLIDVTKGHPDLSTAKECTVLEGRPRQEV